MIRTTLEVQNLEQPERRRALPETLVDTGSELTWIPRQILEELGAHSLEGLNLKIDPVRKELITAGPVIAAAAA